MRTPTLTFLLAGLLACGGDDNTSAGSDAGPDTTTDATGSAGTTSSGGSSSDPTTGGSDSGSSGTDATATTGSVEIGVEDAQAMCVGHPLFPDDLHTPPAAAPALTAKALGGGAVAVQETEYEDSCGYTFTPVILEAGAATLTLGYETSGEPADCICLFTIDFTLTGLSPGTWTIVRGDLSVIVDVT